MIGQKINANPNCYFKPNTKSFIFNVESSQSRRLKTNILDIFHPFMNFNAWAYLSRRIYVITKNMGKIICIWGFVNGNKCKYPVICITYTSCNNLITLAGCYKLTCICQKYGYIVGVIVYKLQIWLILREYTKSLHIFTWNALSGNICKFLINPTSRPSLLL